MLNLIRALCPYPTITEEGILSDGYQLAQSRDCQKCSKKECVHAYTAISESPIYYTNCPKGFSLVRLSFPVGKVLLNSILIAGSNNQCSPSFRKAHKAHKIHLLDVHKWYELIPRILPDVGKYAEEKAKELILGLHDVSTAVSLVTRNAEVIISRLDGSTDEEKIENATPSLKALLKSVELLRTRLSMSSILANPQSASFGQKHPTPIYKIFHRMVRLFEELAAKRHVNIKMTGSSHAKPNCFNSFETIPLVLIDNAVKYSLQDQTVSVIIHDKNQSSVKVAVQSNGPVIPAENQQNIFERGFRTAAAERFSSQGSGLGLYIADIVAKAHGFSIQYKCFGVTQVTHCGWNEFSFEI
jgi:hypothetical protein